MKQKSVYWNQEKTLASSKLQFLRLQTAVFTKKNSNLGKEKLQFARLWSKCHSLAIEKFSLSNLKNACMQFRNRLFRTLQIWRFATDIVNLLTLCYTSPHRHPATGVSVDKPNIFNALHAITDTYAKNKRTLFCQRQRCRFRWKATAFLIYRYLGQKRPCSGQTHQKYPRGFHFFYRHEISQLSSRESRKSRRRRVASPALVGFAECLQPDGTHKR